MGGARFNARRKEVFRVRPAVLLISAFISLLLQTFLPLTTPAARLFDFPLLVTIYFSVFRQHKIFGIWLGTILGLLQDALSHGYLGIMGAADAVIGYLAASVGIKLNLEGILARGLLTGLLVIVHDLCVFGLLHAMLETPPPLRSFDMVSSALVNMATALLLFQILDRFKRST